MIQAASVGDRLDLDVEEHRLALLLRMAGAVADPVGHRGLSGLVLDVGGLHVAVGVGDDLLC